MRNGDGRSPKRPTLDIVREAVLSKASEEELSFVSVSTKACNPAIAPGFDSDEADLLVVFAKVAESNSNADRKVGDKLGAGAILLANWNSKSIGWRASRS